jgi:anti-sigma B factor antagonist
MDALFKAMNEVAAEEPTDAVEAREHEMLSALADTDDGSPLRVRVERQGDVPVVALHGELDISTAGTFQERLDEVLGGAPRGVVVDLSGTSFIDSTGLAVFLRASRTMPGRLAVAAPNPRIARLFQATGLSESVSLRPSRAAALQALAGESSEPAGG